METIKKEATGSDVVLLQQLLNKWGYKVDETGIFDEQTDIIVRDFQRKNKLDVDGIVGKFTWGKLEDENARQKATLKLTEDDFIRCAAILGVEVAAVKAVQEVETGGRGGFFAPGYPAILFEGHIFWSQLKKNGVNPENCVNGNEDILYQKWTKSHYKSGMAEYERLKRALAINEKAAYCSASWGLFQIMGFNYEVCGCKSVKEFVEKMSASEGYQLELFTAFLKSNGWDKYLRTLNWAEFARHYNGPQYAANKYDEKLRRAYLKYK
jgi:hypothetical protein